VNRWRLRLLVASIGALALLGPALPARADHNADQHSPNMELLAHLDRSSPATQSDLAFTGRYALAANYNGFRVIDVSRPRRPVVVRDVWCPGPQNDISVWGDVIVVSIDSVRTNPSCTSAAASPATDPNGWEGVRVFGLSQVLSASPDPDGFTRVEPVAAVATDCGSHTHTGVPDRRRVLIYVSSYPLSSGPRCGPQNAARFGYDPLHRKISIVEVPLAHPEQANLLKTVPVDVPTWNIYDLAPNLPPGFNPIRGCHDIQVDLRADLAAAACASVGQLWDISDPENPRTLHPRWQADEPQVQFYHSALFSEDRRTVIFGDEIIVGTCNDGTGSGQLWFHSRRTGRTISSFQIPRGQGGAYCSAHMFNNIPGIRRDVLVAAWYNGGTTVVDYTNRAHPTEIGYYDPANQVSGAWSSYWYNRFIYSNDITRGFDVLRLRDPVTAGADKLRFLNPQTQY
jgi:LVIVD repeat-containing protein